MKTEMTMRLRFFILFLILLCCAPAKANVVGTESIGHLFVSDFLLQPHFQIQEGSSNNSNNASGNTGFDWGESQFGIGWRLDSQLQGKVKVGPLALLNRQQFYNPRPDKDWGVIEAYGEWESPYGRFRMGLLPIEYSEEGAMSEAELYFQRSLLFSQGVIALRDVGFNYYILHNGFFTSLTVHNGEAGMPEDSRTWYTAKWGWQDRNKFRIGVAGQTGSTEPSVTASSTSQLGDFDVSKEAKWRMGSVFIKWYPSDFKMLLEAHLGEAVQDNKLKEKFAAGHFDVMWDWTPKITLLTRYDHFDPNTKLDGDLQRRASVGFVLSNPTRTSQLFLVGSKVFEEGKTIPNDEIRLMWRLTPLSPIN